MTEGGVVWVVGGDAWCELSPVDMRIFEVVVEGNARVCGVYPAGSEGGQVTCVWRGGGRVEI